MRRRLSIASAVALIAVGAAQDVRALGIDSAVLVEPDAPAVLVRRFEPAGGPMERFESRPGAWYALLYVPVAPQWPMALSFWPPERRHELRLTALDVPPDEAPTVAFPLRLELERQRGSRNVQRVSRFAMPATSRVQAIFVLLEQWSFDGGPPPPLWVQLRADSPPSGAREPWWQPRDATQPVQPPPSPLTQRQRQRGIVDEIPILDVPPPPPGPELNR
jgi:hypothetical protein